MLKAKGNLYHLIHDNTGIFTYIEMAYPPENQRKKVSFSLMFFL